MERLSEPKPDVPGGGWFDIPFNYDARRPTMASGRFRKKPVEIDAVQYDGTYQTVTSWLGSLGYDPEDGDGVPNMYEADGGLVIETLEGDMRADLGDWIIRGVKGEFYPCKPDIFAVTYDPA